MGRAFLPFHFYASRAVSDLLPVQAERVAVLALRAVLRERRSLEVAHQQVRYGGHNFAFSSRITDDGILVLDLDVGDPKLAHRIVLEEDLRAATRKTKGLRDEERARRR